jgi:hypothetical protein
MVFKSCSLCERPIEAEEAASDYENKEKNEK